MIDCRPAPGLRTRDYQPFPSWPSAFQAAPTQCISLKDERGSAVRDRVIANNSMALPFMTSGGTITTPKGSIGARLWHSTSQAVEKGIEW